MKKQRFTGPMGHYMKQHLELRRSLGFLYKSAEYDLDMFDQHLANHFSICRTISREMIESYLNTTLHKKSLTRAQCISNLRQFCRFMFQLDCDTYIPERDLVGSVHIRIKPHIFSEEEIFNLIRQAKKLRSKNKLLPHTYSMIIGLLWVTGMRIGELVNLKIEDVDTVNAILYIGQTKFFKSRLIPLSASSTQALIAYKKEREKFYSEETGTPFFFNYRGKSCITATTPRTIRALMIKAGLKTVQGKTPRVHDIRHTFATRWLTDFYRSGQDPSAYLAVLATYLGHANIAHTQVYLHPSIELLNVASQKAQSYIQSLSGRIL